MNRALILTICLLMTAGANADTALIVFRPPTQNTNGTPVSALTYKLYRGACGSALAYQRQVFARTFPVQCVAKHKYAIGLSAVENGLESQQATTCFTCP